MKSSRHLAAEAISSRRSEDVGTPTTTNNTTTTTSNTMCQEKRLFFKKSHTCGSLYAKCGCSQENVQTPLLQIFSHPEVPQEVVKRSSNPTSSKSSSSIPSCRTYRGTVEYSKRLSNPELNNTKLHCSSTRYGLNSDQPRQVHFLNHPEIPYPVPLVSPRRRSSERPPVRENGTSKEHLNWIPFDVKFGQTNLNYLKFTALAYQNIVEGRALRDADPAVRYFEESGIVGPLAMGNGLSTSDPDAVQQIRKTSAKMTSETRTASARNSEGAREDYDYLKIISTHLRKKLSDMELKYETTRSKLAQTRHQLRERESEVTKLQREIHKLRSVLQQATCFGGGSERDILSTLQEDHTMIDLINGDDFIKKSSCCQHQKKKGVSAESGVMPSGGQPVESIPVQKYDKDFRSKQTIKDAIMENNFLKQLDSLQVREIVDSMYSKEFAAGSYVIREGEAGAHLFVSADGEFEVVKDDKVLGRMGSGKAFGELAVLYNCTRTASIRVVEDASVWVLDRRVFQNIMVRTGLQKLQDNVNFLRSVPLLENLNSEVLAKIADVLEVEFYPAGAYIIRQGAKGDTFFIISSGSVKVTQRVPGRMEEDEIRILQRGDYFGEQALLKEDRRTASVIALNPGVECLTLDRDSFIQLIGDISEIKEKDYGDRERTLSRFGDLADVQNMDNSEYDHISLNDLDTIATLGVGGFGRVELVQHARDKKLTFALKSLKKHHIVETQQQEHIFSEKLIMMSCRSPFICRLYRTFRDAKYVYMLLEVCLGGEVWTILRDRGYFDDHTTRFITACVVEAFDYLHDRGIIYRDLKPENLLLDDRGYVKLADFGFSKSLGYSGKTWTFCGTPEYVAPETILNKGHDRSVDYWALGVLMYELLTGNPPFTAADPMRTYNLILRGIDAVDFASSGNVTRSAQSLIKKLCRDLPSERLGYQRAGVEDIKKHRWFQGFDWDGLAAGTLRAPIIPVVRNPCDISNFDRFPADNQAPPDDLSGWDEEF